MKQLFLIMIISGIFSACGENNNADKHIPLTADSSITTDTTNTAVNRANTDTIVANMETNLIVPGKKIGKAELGTNDNLLETEFGKPDMSDAAMGKAWLTWYGKKRDEHNNRTELNIYTAYKDTSMREKTVQQIRTTSSFFETENGLHVYASLQDIQSKFHNLEKVATYTDSGRKIIIYDILQRGIAFEIATANDQQICVGIIVHRPGIKVTQTYITLHPDMHILKGSK